MQPTSHFLGLSLHPMLLDALFDELGEYIREHQLQDMVQLQSPESLHITIYYLDAVLSDMERSTCIGLLDGWTIARKRNIHLRWCEYFYRENSPYILYIASDNIAYFTHKNKQASEQLHRNDILENQFLFVPHITIMRILDADAFAPHSEDIESMIQSHIEGIWDNPIQDGFALYSVDSHVSPELQERLVLN